MNSCPCWHEAKDLHTFCLSGVPSSFWPAFQGRIEETGCPASVRRQGFGCFRAIYLPGFSWPNPENLCNSWGNAWNSNPLSTVNRRFLCACLYVCRCLNLKVRQTTTSDWLITAVSYFCLLFVCKSCRSLFPAHLFLLFIHLGLLKHLIISWT